MDARKRFSRVAGKDDRH